MHARWEILDWHYFASKTHLDCGWHQSPGWAFGVNKDMVS